VARLPRSPREGRRAAMTPFEKPSAGPAPPMLFHALDQAGSAGLCPVCMDVRFSNSGRPPTPTPSNLVPSDPRASSASSTDLRGSSSFDQRLFCMISLPPLRFFFFFFKTFACRACEGKFLARSPLLPSCSIFVVLLVACLLACVAFFLLFASLPCPTQFK